MKKSFLTILMICMAAISSMAQVDKNKADESPYNPLDPAMISLSIAPDARGGGMGDVGAATEPDEMSQYWNPAKYAFAYSRSGLALNYVPWLRKLVSGINIMNAAGYYKFGYDDNQAVSASLTYFSLGEVQVVSSDGKGGYTETQQYINPMEFSIDLGYSRMLSDNFSMGVVFRYLYSKMAYEDTGNAGHSAFAADVAAYYEAYPVIGNNECCWAWGLNISNIGSRIETNGSAEDDKKFLPTRLRLGTSFTFPLDDYNIISLNLDADKLMIPARPNKNYYDLTTDEGNKAYYKDLEDYNDMNGFVAIFKSWTDAPRGFAEELEEINLGFGLEYQYDRRFALRGGYHYEHPNKGGRKYFTMGAGIKLNIFHLDAAYVMSSGQTSGLDQTLRFTLGFDLEGLRDMMGKSKRR